jgi:hypothetical protein
VADGTDQPGNGGTTLAVTILGPDSWKVIRKRNGTLLLTAIWRLSADGRTLTDSYTAMRPDGSSSTTDYRYTRATAGSGFPAMWESTTTASAYELQIQAYQDDGLTFTYPAQKRTRSMKFDGKDYADSGPNMPGGAATSGRRVNEGTLNLTSKIDGKVTGTQEMTVSPDRKTLTVTARPPGAGMPNVYVFDRE